MLIQDNTWRMFDFLHVILNQCRNEFVIFFVVEFNHGVKLFFLRYFKFELQFFNIFLEIYDLFFVCFDFFFQLKYLIGRNDQFLSGLCEYLWKLIAEVFEHDLIFLFYFSQIQQMIEFLFQLLEFFNISQLIFIIW